MEHILLKLKELWVKNEQKIVLLVGFCLISGISFGFGLLQGQKMTSKPLIIEKPANEPATTQVAQEGATKDFEAIPAAPAKGSVASTASPEGAACAFVGSKNSDKFYVPTCAYAKRVKPENLVCYQSEQEALSRGKSKSDCK